MFRARKQTPQGISNPALMWKPAMPWPGMTIAYNDKPLAPQGIQVEEDRLAGLAGNADQLHRKHLQEQENAERTLRIVKALPDAFLYQYDGEEIGEANAGDPGRTFGAIEVSSEPGLPTTYTRRAGSGRNGRISGNRPCGPADRENRRNLI